MHELPEIRRNVMGLRDIQGLDIPAAAAVLGISANAIKTRLHRARRSLRAVWESASAGSPPGRRRPAPAGGACCGGAPRRRAAAGLLVEGLVARERRTYGDAMKPPPPVLPSTEDAAAQLLLQATRGDAAVASRLSPRVHGELRRAAGVCADRERAGLDDLLERQRQLDAREARVVALRFCVAMTDDRIAEVLDAAGATVVEDWAVARAWPAAQLRTWCGS